MFENSRFIWRTADFKPDEYAEFHFAFSHDGSSKTLALTCGSDYNLFINGKLIAFGQYPDYPKYRVYDILKLNDALQIGENSVDIVVWYYGSPSAGYALSDAYLAFELTDENGNILVRSDEQILCRTVAGYTEHLATRLTPQLGIGWSYDPRIPAGDYHKSVVLPTPVCEWEKRPIEKLSLKERVDGTLIDNGFFRYTKADERPAELMQRAVFYDNPTDGYDGQYWLVDLGREYVGFPEFAFEADEECDIMIGWGEHINDGRCRTATRDYALFYHAVPGQNHLLSSFRRLGCRYLQFFVKKSTIRFGYLGIRPTNYPVTRKAAPTGLTELQKKIYDTSVYTLECCMHDHYEDCPWREQALYTLDSRNQMLCGYYAFGETRFARASLKLISHGQRPDRLLTLTFPTSLDSPIPYYSLAYFLQLDEYVRHSKDTTIVEEVMPLLEDLIDLFKGRMNERDLLCQFAGCWNYYEWSDGMAGQEEPDPTEEDAPLAAFFVLALEAMSSLCRTIDKPHTEYDVLAEKVRRAIGKYFYDPESKLFQSYQKTGRGIYSVMNNAVCLLCGAAEGLDQSNILEILTHNGAGSLPYPVVPNTLSMNSFRFDALLRIDRATYASVILAEIDRDYQFMLENGATTFWETIKGADDMWYGASLCHGWSALPVYYYSILT